LLLLRNGVNLFVDDVSDWDGTCIPSFLVAPAFFAEIREGGQRRVCIDEADEGFNDDKGKALFACEENT